MSRAFFPLFQQLSQWKLSFLDRRERIKVLVWFPPPTGGGGISIEQVVGLDERSKGQQSNPKHNGDDAGRDFSFVDHRYENSLVVIPLQKGAKLMQDVAIARQWLERCGCRFDRRLVGVLR